MYMISSCDQDGHQWGGNLNPDDHVQVSADRSTIWVHAADGSTVGRFSMRFGMDVHTTVTEQLQGRSQCLHCTHQPPTHADWLLFCGLMHTHHGIDVPRDLLRPESFVKANAKKSF